MPDDPLKNRAQEALIDFLRVDTALAFTLLKTAAIDADIDPAHSQSAIDKARAALDTIRRLVNRVQDDTVRAEIESRTDELEAAINAVQHRIEYPA